MAEEKQRISDILKQFQAYLQTEEAKQHIEAMKSEKTEVKMLMQRLSSLDKTSKEFTELTIYGLLPYSKTKVAKRVSLFPAFMNIMQFFKDYNYGDEDWNKLANMIYDLCSHFQKTPEDLNNIIKRFSENKYSRRLQCGSITPILFCLNDRFPVVNNRTIRAFKGINLLMGVKEKLSQKLEEYPENVRKLKDFVKRLGFDLLRNDDYLDLFCYWYDSTILHEERETEKGGPERIDDEADKEEYKRPIEVNLNELIAVIDLSDVSKFSPHILRNPERIKIKDIVHYSEKGNWVLPHFQRYFDWKKEDIRSFLEAIFNDYYIGAFLLWDTEEEPEVDIQAIIGVNKAKEEIRPHSIILDGQQRITSLFYSIKAPSVPGFENKHNWRKTKIFKEHPLYFYINFNSFLRNDKANGLIEVLKKKLTREETFNLLLFPLYELEKYNEWVFEFEKFLRNKSEKHDKIYEIREIIRKKLSHMWEGFEVPYISLPKTMDIGQVTDIFEGINSTGIKLSVFDLLIARLYKYDINLKELWDSAREEYAIIDRYSRDIEKMPIYILQAISLLYEKNSSCKRKDILDLYKNAYINSDRSFEDDWDDVSEYMKMALEKMENTKDGFGVKDEKELPFAPMIPVLTALLMSISTQENKADCFSRLDKWYWSSVFGNSYSSAADTQMTSDFKEMREWFKKEDAIPKTVVNMKKEITGLTFRDVQSKSNGKYRGIMSLVALEGAKDFDTAQTLENARNNDKDHIFPHSFNFGFGSHKHVNSILNMTWMSGETNRKIKRYKKPSIYAKEFVSQKYAGDESKFANILKTHLITKKGYEYLGKDNFEDFLNEREEAILSKLKEHLEMSEEKSEQTLISPGSPFTNKRIVSNAIKSCENYICWVDKYFSRAGLELLRDSLDENRIKEVKILTSVDKVDDTFRHVFKDFREELKNKGISCQLRVIIDNKIKSNIHDRWIISKNECFNIPSTDVMTRGQYSEIKRTNSRPPFEEWWNGSKDIINEWNEIKRNLTKER